MKQGKRWQTKEVGPLQLSLTWGCQQLKMPGLPLCFENKRKKGWEFFERETRKEGMADNRTGKEGAIHLTPHDNILQQLRPCRNGEPPTLHLCRGSNLHKINDVAPNAGQFRLICCTQL